MLLRFKLKTYDNIYATLHATILTMVQVMAASCWLRYDAYLLRYNKQRTTSNVASYMTSVRDVAMLVRSVELLFAICYAQSSLTAHCSLSDAFTLSLSF